jgi:hypothetical protein
MCYADLRSETAEVMNAAFFVAVPDDMGRGLLSGVEQHQRATPPLMVLPSTHAYGLSESGRAGRPARWPRRSARRCSHRTIVARGAGGGYGGRWFGR